MFKTGKKSPGRTFTFEIHFTVVLISTSTQRNFHDFRSGKIFLFEQNRETAKKENFQQIAQNRIVPRTTIVKKKLYFHEEEEEKQIF